MAFIWPKVNHKTRLYMTSPLPSFVVCIKQGAESDSQANGGDASEPIRFRARCSECFSELFKNIPRNVNKTNSSSSSPFSPIKMLTINVNCATWMRPQ